MTSMFEAAQQYLKIYDARKRRRVSYWQSARYRETGATDVFDPNYSLDRKFLTAAVIYYGLDSGAGRKEFGDFLHQYDNFLWGRKQHKIMTKRILERMLNDAP